MRRIGYRKDLFKSSMRKNRKFSIKPPGGLIYFTVGSVLHRPRIKNGKAQVQEVGGHAAEDQKHLAELPVGE